MANKTSKKDSENQAITIVRGAQHEIGLFEEADKIKNDRPEDFEHLPKRIRKLHTDFTRAIEKFRTSERVELWTPRSTQLQLFVGARLFDAYKSRKQMGEDEFVRQIRELCDYATGALKRRISPSDVTSLLAQDYSLQSDPPKGMGVSSLADHRMIFITGVSKNTPSNQRSRQKRLNAVIDRMK